MKRCMRIRGSGKGYRYKSFRENSITSLFSKVSNQSVYPLKEKNRYLVTLYFPVTRPALL